MAGYKPTQERDEHGRWEDDDGNPSPSTVALAVLDPNNKEKADALAKIAEETARDLGFDPKFVTVSDESKQFELNGKQYNYAGAAFLDSHTDNPEIAIYTPHVDANSAHGVLAHEIQHQKFQAFINDYRKDYEAMQRDLDYQKQTEWVPFDSSNASHVAREKAGEMVTTDRRIREGFMKPDGSLYEPYASRYPIYTAWTEANKPMSDDFAKSDGVSGYSRDWWDAYAANKVQLPQAMHETLAEIARIKYGQQRDKAAHVAMVKYIREHGGTWTPADEKEWQKNRNDRIGHIVRKKDGLLTARKNLDPIWNTLYRAVEANWKRRTKK